MIGSTSSVYMGVRGWFVLKASGKGYLANIATKSQTTAKFNALMKYAG
jgi:hypothetical protein